MNNIKYLGYSIDIRNTNLIFDNGSTLPTRLILKAKHDLKKIMCST